MTGRELIAKLQAAEGERPGVLDELVMLDIGAGFTADIGAGLYDLTEDDEPPAPAPVWRFAITYDA